MHSGGAWLSKKQFVRFTSLLLMFPLISTQGEEPQPRTSTAAASGYLDPLPQETGAAGLRLQLRKLQTTGRLMMVVAHPDDEDGGLLTREARGKGIHTLLLTLTRGEGGQNKTGDTFSDALGLLRALELLASDRYYGVEQRFTRVADFGYSKTADETFQKWGGHDVPLQDIVHVIREFRPDVLIARFSGTERDGHGHHQASAILTQEAFRAAADPNRFPEQIKQGLQVWQAKKLYIGNVCGFGASSCSDENYTVKLNTGEDDPVLGTSYVQFAIEGLRHQSSQGLADLSTSPGPHYAFYKLVDSVVPSSKDAVGHEKDFFDGLDVSLPGLAAKYERGGSSPTWLKEELTKVAGHLGESVGDLSNTVQELASITDRLTEASADSRGALLESMAEKNEEAHAALNDSLNLGLDVTVAPPNGPQAPIPTERDALTAVSPGQRFEIIAKLHNPSKYWLSIEDTTLNHHDWVRRTHAERITIGPGEDYFANFLVQVPLDAPISRPYWHRDDPQTESIYKIDPGYETRSLPPNPLRVTIDFEVAGHGGLHSPAPDFLRKKSKPAPQGTIHHDVQVLFTDEKGIQRRRDIAITPAFSVRVEPAQQVKPLADRQAMKVNVAVTSNLTGAPAGTLRLTLPAGWKAQPESENTTPEKRGGQKQFSFQVLPENLSQSHRQAEASLTVGESQFLENYSLITREDLGSFNYFQPAVQHISVVDVQTPKDLRVGYVMGAGDDIPIVLQQIGMKVTVIPAEKIATENLAQYGAIVLGVRAYDTHQELVANNQRLLDFVTSGGTLIVQNNNGVGEFNSEHLTPYPAELSRARVSVEEAPVQVLLPESQVFHYPNEISQKDFDGWVQERGLYFMDSWDENFQPLLACHDPGEQDQKGGLLLAKQGKGTYIYTGYAFFRQLPAGVPGAIRLFVNLVSAGVSSKR